MLKYNHNEGAISSKTQYIIPHTVDEPLNCLKLGVAGAKPPYRSSAICATASVHRQPFVPLHRATALCGCLYASLHSGFVWLTASIIAWSRGGSPSNIAPSQGEGVWGQGQRICSIFHKNRLFLQADIITFLFCNGSDAVTAVAPTMSIPCGMLN